MVVAIGSNRDVALNIVRKNPRQEHEMELKCSVDCEEEESLEYCQICDDDNQGNPTKFLPPSHVYSSRSSCFAASGSSNVVSKKVRAHKFSDHLDESGMMLHPLLPSLPEKPPLISVYRRRSKHLRTSTEISPPLFDSFSDHTDLLRPIKPDVRDSSEGCNGETSFPNRSADIQIGLDAFLNKNVDDSVNLEVEMSLPPKRLKSNSSARFSRRRKHSSSVDCPQMLYDSSCSKYWVRLKVIGVDPKSFVGLKCKVFWPLDDEWYFGCIHSYNFETNMHNVEYEDGDKEDIIIGNEDIEFFVSRLNMKALNLICDSSNALKDGLDFDEMTVLAFIMDDFQGLEPGDVIWAKLTGYAMWPAIVVDKGSIMQLFQNGRRGSISVQFFGTHDYARVKKNHVISFLKGLLSSFHLKCKKPRFVESLKEAKMYLSEQRLPSIMLQSHVQDMTQTDGLVCSPSEVYGRDDSNIIENMEDREHQTPPFKSEDLEVLCLGKIVEDSNHFQDESSIWPEGYTAVRKFLSLTGPETSYLYKMQVLRDAKFRNRPLFRVTLDSGVQFEGATPSSCWNKIYEKVKKRQEIVVNGCEEKTTYPSGSAMFGFSNPVVSKLIQDLSESRLSSNLSISNLASKEQQHVATGYRPVHIEWKDLDKCNVCHMDEEYENNLFLQCDRCRIMVHSRCYGESERVNGVLWLCNLCRPDAPRCLPTCCLCPVIGGAMKPTTDGRWAHLACAIWIPETCLLDIKRMEPIDGLNGIHKGRWKLLCSICGVPYGACIQCSNGSCRVAYHPLCARAAGLCVEPEDEERIDLLSMDDDVDNHCIRLLSFCKKHTQLRSKRHAVDEQMINSLHECSKYTPPPNMSGCARAEPYNHSGRRGRKEPEDFAAAPLKRLFVEDRPSLVRGCCRQELLRNSVISGAIDGPEHSICFHKSNLYKHDDCGNILSQTEQYELMKMTYRKRLTFGKSSIHGFGVFANQPVKGGDMVIEYSGELVRPSVADRREKFIYNSLVGAGTYMFRIDDDRVIDATRAGSIAHLINHSCEPNCYSRVVSVNDEDHIVICSKRDIRQWEELTYDYRFFSIDETLSCYCGFPSCRGVVNDSDATTRLSRLLVSRSLLVDCCSE